MDYHWKAVQMSKPDRTIEIPCHPGECLRDSVEASGESLTHIAERIGIDRSNLYRLLDGRIAMSARVAIALESIGWSTAEHWLRLQNAYDLAKIRRELAT